MNFTDHGIKFKHKPKAIVVMAFFTLIEYFLTTIFYISLSASIWYPEKTMAAMGVSKTLSYQGRLTDAADNPLGGSGTNYCFRFSLYNSSTGGTKVWPSNTPNTDTINVVNGVFNAGIGQVDDLDNFNFYENYDTGVYLNIEVNNTPLTCTGSWETLLPRQKINAVGYARVARDVYGDLLRTLNSASSPRVQIGTGMGSNNPVYFSLDVKNSGAEPIGGSDCDSSIGEGRIWYNSTNGRALICENNVFRAVGNSSELSGVKVDGASSLISSGSLVFSGGNNITLSQITGAAGGTIIISAGANGGNGLLGIGDGTQTASAGTVVFSNSNGVSFGLSGQVMTASFAPSASVTAGIAGIGGGAQTITGGTVQLFGGNNVTLSQDGNAITILGGAFNQSAQTQNVHNVVLGGNTTGIMSTISSGVMTLAGGNNITLSQDGNAITIVGPSNFAASDFLGTGATSLFLGTAASGSFLRTNATSYFLGTAASGSFMQTSNASNYLTTAMASNAGSNFLSNNAGSLFLGSAATANFLSNNAGSNFLASNAGSNFLSNNAGSLFLGSNAGTGFMATGERANYLQTANSSLLQLSGNYLTTAMASNAGSLFLGSAATANFLSNNAGSNFLASNAGSNFLSNNAGSLFLGSNAGTGFMATGERANYLQTANSSLLQLSGNYLTTAMASNAGSLFLGSAATANFLSNKF